MQDNLTATMMNHIEAIASKNYGGHYTILKFTTNWKGFYGTPDTDIRIALDKSIAYVTLNELLFNMIVAADAFDYERLTEDKIKVQAQNNIEGRLKTLDEIREQARKNKNDNTLFYPFNAE